MKKLINLLYLIYCVAIFVTLMFVALPLVLIATAALARKTGKKVSLLVLKYWAALFSYFSFINIKTEKQPADLKDNAVIYVCNHSSFLDAVVVAKEVPGPFSPLGKVEMTKIPVFGWIYAKVVVLIDRKDKESRESSVRILKNELSEGISIFIFPEGTMNRTSQRLKDFYSGAFKIAIETQTRIQPVVIKNAGKLLPSDNILAIKPGTIKVIFGQTIDVKGMGLDQTDALKAQVWTQMYNMLA